jgi:hypothetical protein
MTERELTRWPDAALAEALRRLEAEIAWPGTGQGDDRRDVAGAVRARIDAGLGDTSRSRRLGRPWSFLPPGWARIPARRALLIAVALLLLLAAIAGAAGIDLPGLRVQFGGGPSSPPEDRPSIPPSSLGPVRSSSPSPTGAPGARLGLGDPVAPADRAALDAVAEFHVALPTEPDIGPPDAAYVDVAKHGQVSAVWATRAGLPPTLEPGVGLLLTEFRGSVDEGIYTKLTDTGTSVEAVRVDGRRGHWLSGAPHFFFYTGPSGLVQDDRRWVGDALIWADGPVTYRLESALGRDATLAIAESLD